MVTKQVVTLVTSNRGKLVEWQRLFPAEFKLDSADIDLPEIQSMDLIEIIEDKARRAYELVGSPVLVEDVSAGLVKLAGLPGPFIKYFEVHMGKDALFQLADREGDAAIVTCTVAYYDGESMVTAKGITEGTVVPSRGDNGFGFDAVFMPNSSTKTYGEMNAQEKDAVSHRSKAIIKLTQMLSTLTV